MIFSSSSLFYSWLVSLSFSRERLQYRYFSFVWWWLSFFPSFLYFLFQSGAVSQVLLAFYCSLMITIISFSVSLPFVLFSTHGVKFLCMRCSVYDLTFIDLLLRTWRKWRKSCKESHWRRKTNPCTFIIMSLSLSLSLFLCSANEPLQKFIDCKTRYLLKWCSSVFIPFLVRKTRERKTLFLIPREVEIWLKLFQMHPDFSSRVISLVSMMMKANTACLGDILLCSFRNEVHFEKRNERNEVNDSHFISALSP